MIEAVGTQESMMQVIRSTRPGGHVGFVGVTHDVQVSGDELFFSHVHLHGAWHPHDGSDLMRRSCSRRSPTHHGGRLRISR